MFLNKNNFDTSLFCLNLKAAATYLYARSRVAHLGLWGSFLFGPCIQYSMKLRPFLDRWPSNTGLTPCISHLFMSSYKCRAISWSLSSPLSENRSLPDFTHCRARKEALHSWPDLRLFQGLFALRWLSLVLKNLRGLTGSYSSFHS